MSSLIAVDDTLGAALIGFAFSCVVFGVNTNQVFTYFQRYPGDRLAYKFLVRRLLHQSGLPAHPLVAGLSHLVRVAWLRFLS